jgi:hypothetical protein
MRHVHEFFRNLQAVRHRDALPHRPVEHFALARELAAAAASRKDNAMLSSFA